MALVLDGYEARVTLIDTGANRSVKEYQLTATTFADALSDTQAIIALLDPLTTAVVEKYTVGPRFVEDAFAWPQNSQIENIMQLSALLATGIDKTATIFIPSPVNTVWISTTGKGNNVVNIANADVLAYVNMYAAGGYATISDGENVAAAGALQSGKRIHRKSKKG